MEPLSSLLGVRHAASVTPPYVSMPDKAVCIPSRHAGARLSGLCDTLDPLPLLPRRSGGQSSEGRCMSVNALSASCRASLRAVVRPIPFLPPAPVLRATWCSCPALSPSPPRYWAVEPPSMTSSLPVTNADSSEARYNTP